MQKSLKFFFTSVLLASCGTSLAVPFNSIDPRSMAMGGAGVAVGDAKIAPFFNPALLTITPEEDDFTLALPIVGVRAYDPENFATSLDNFQNGKYVENLDASITAYNGTQNGTTLATVSGNISTLSSELSKLSGKPIQVELGAGMVIGIPSKSFGAALYADGWAAMGGVIKYKDDQVFQNFATVSGQVANTLNFDCAGSFSTATPQCATALSTLQNDSAVATYFQVDTTTNPAAPTVTSNFNSNNLQSSVDIRGVMLSEVGIALSSEFTFAESALGIGLTPKIVSATLIDYSADVNSSNTGNSTDSDYTAKYTSFNFDLGLAHDYANGWRSGFVIKNVIPKTYDFKRAPVLGVGATPVPTGDTIKLKPQARVGVSHSNSWSTVAMDLDLTANDPAGFENKSQYLALGGELNAWGWAQLRAGYRANLKDTARNVTSVGVGLGPLDVTVAGSGTEVGASVALGFTF